MLQEKIFICGDNLLAHPVSYLFHLDGDVSRGEPDNKALKNKSLAIADCRLLTAARIADCQSKIESAGTPLLLLCPAQDHIDALADQVGLMPLVPAAAILIESRENSAGLTNYSVRALNYTVLPSGLNEFSGESKVAEEGTAPQVSGSGAECACIDFSVLGGILVDPAAADMFKTHVEVAMDGGSGDDEQSAIPTGLKYFLHNFNASVPFTYAYGTTKNKSAGSADFTWTVWGFLNESKDETSQVLVVEGRLNLNAGSLHANTSCDRGFVNCYLKGTLEAPMDEKAFVPVSGSGTFTGSVKIPISYKSPTGGYQIWEYEGGVANTVTSWKCTSISSGTKLGAEWSMSKPVDGADVNSTWSNAFDFWGHVNGMPGASTGALSVNSIAAWFTKSLKSGNVAVQGSFGWEGYRFFGGNCSPGMYWSIHAEGIYFYNVNPGFIVDFSPITPS